MKVKMAKPARSSKIARCHIMSSIERCLNNGGGPVEVDYGRYIITVTGYRQVGLKGNTGVGVIWKLV